MIIVSQNKSGIINYDNIENIYIETPLENNNKFSVEAVGISDNKYTLGYYETEERANKVLKAIKKKRENRKTVTIDGEKYIKNLETGKLYSMPRTVTTRKIARNRMRKLMKNQGVSKINKNLASFWHKKVYKSLI